MFVSSLVRNLRHLFWCYYYCYGIKYQIYEFIDLEKLG